MRSRLLMTVGALAAVLVVGACVPPPPPNNPGSGTTTPTTPPPPACPATPSSAPGPDSQSPISSWGVNGTAYTTAVVGDVVYVGGMFTQAVSPNGQTVSRSNLAAFCLANGSLLSTFVANVNGQVWALTTDGTSLFVGGDFTTLNGAPVNRLVKLNPATGARDTNFNPPAIANVVLALDYFGGNVYLGCDCSVGANPILGKKGASLDGTTGAFTGWNPNTDAKIESIRVSRPSGQWVYIGGAFEDVQGQAHDKLAKLARADAAVQSVVYSSVAPGVVGARVFDLAVNPNNEDQVFAALGPKSGSNPPPPSGSGNRFVAFNASGGTDWNDTEPDGDGQTVELIGSIVYAGFHDGWNGDNTKRLEGLNAATGNTTGFAPSTGGVLGVFDLAQGGNRLVAVGDFNSMGSTNKLNGVAIFN